MKLSVGLAMQHSPGPIFTIFCCGLQVNGTKMKAFVDSGAQMTIMSQQAAERCNILRLMDTRWAGMARGVGTGKILGRVHQVGHALSAEGDPCQRHWQGMSSACCSLH